jgi:hypothetical protein
MSDGTWSGGTANRSWSRHGSRHYQEELTEAEVRELFEDKADEPFWCESCGATHPLSEHRECRGKR